MKEDFCMNAAEIRETRLEEYLFLTSDGVAYIVTKDNEAAVRDIRPLNASLEDFIGREIRIK